jgi:hypothetical protein
MEFIHKKSDNRLALFVSLAVGMALNFFLDAGVGEMIQATGTAVASQYAENVDASNGKIMRSKT